MGFSGIDFWVGIVGDVAFVVERLIFRVPPLLQSACVLVACCLVGYNLG